MLLYEYSLIILVGFVVVRMVLIILVVFVVVRIVLDHFGGVCGGTNSLKSSCEVCVGTVLDHLGGVCGGTNCLRSSWWGLWWYE